MSFQKKFEATMINFNLETLPKKVKIQDSHYMQNDQNLFFICLFPHMSLRNLVTIKGQWFSFLHENYTNSFPRGVTLQNKGFSEVEHSQY
jgi:hypothetical protein